jgi:hypothetical protein
MKIHLIKDAECGKVIIPRGDYMVSLRSESGEICLSGGGKDFRLPAKKRRIKVKTKTTSISFYSGGGRTWTLMVTTPKYGEWVTFIDYITQ